MNLKLKTYLENKECLPEPQKEKHQQKKIWKG